MKHKYKFRIDEPSPTDEQIDRHRNFDRVLADYRNMTEPLYRRPLYRNPRTFMGLFLILVIGYLVFQAVEEEENEAITATQTEQMRDDKFLQPATQAFKAPALEFEAQPGSAQEFSLSSGATLIVPEGVFETAEGPVSISVTEFAHPLEAILAGVPMELEQSGMALPENIFLISTTVNGQPFSPPADAPFVIEFTDEWQADGSKQGLYLLDQEEKVWKNSAQKVSSEQRRPDSPNPAVNLHDGFNVIEFDEDGQIRSRPLDSEEDDPAEKIRWAHSFNAPNNGYVMTGRSGNLATPNLKLRLLDDAGKAIPVTPLFQTSKDGQQVRSYWPEDSKLTYHVATAGTGQKLFGFNTTGHLVWIDMPMQSSEEILDLHPQISQVPIDNLDQLQVALGISLP